MERGGGNKDYSPNSSNIFWGRTFFLELIENKLVDVLSLHIITLFISKNVTANRQPLFQATNNTNINNHTNHKNNTPHSQQNKWLKQRVCFLYVVCLFPSPFSLTITITTTTITTTTTTKQHNNNNNNNNNNNKTTQQP